MRYTRKNKKYRNKKIKRGGRPRGAASRPQFTIDEFVNKVFNKLDGQQLTPEEQAALQNHLSNADLILDNGEIMNLNLWPYYLHFIDPARNIPDDKKTFIKNRINKQINQIRTHYRRCSRRRSMLGQPGRKARKKKIYLKKKNNR